MNSVKVQSFTGDNAFGLLEVNWNSLLKRSITDTPFSTYEWHSNWWNAYYPGQLWIHAFYDESETLRGIASLFITESDDSEQTVHFVGCEDVTDYLDILVDKDYEDEVYSAFVNTLIEHKEQFDLLDLCNIPAESPTRTKLPVLLQECGFTVEVSVQEVCPVITLPPDFDSYLELLDKKDRKELQRKLRRAKGAGDAIHWYIVTDEHDLNCEVEKFLRLMASSHPEKAAFLKDEQHVTFFKSFVPLAAEAGWLQLNFLEVAGEAVAAYLNFDYNNRILVYNSGLAPGSAAALSPGIVLLAYNIEHAIDNKREIFDFLRGDEQYKYRMGGQNTEIFNLRASLE